jgi:hypothetical protein
MTIISFYKNLINFFLLLPNFDLYFNIEYKYVIFIDEINLISNQLNNNNFTEMQKYNDLLQYFNKNINRDVYTYTLIDEINLMKKNINYIEPTNKVIRYPSYTLPYVDNYYNHMQNIINSFKESNFNFLNINYEYYQPYSGSTYEIKYYEIIHFNKTLTKQINYFVNKYGNIDKIQKNIIKILSDI